VLQLHEGEVGPFNRKVVHDATLEPANPDP